MNDTEYKKWIVAQLRAHLQSVRNLQERAVLDEGHSWGLRMPDAEPKKRGAA